jgi:2-polyprenyl-3-methyl-5-hydroxy-6-metoxy-1,4-benzoquinol methylase
MDTNIDYIATNKALWNAKTPHHIDSAFYRHSDFKAGLNTLNEIELKLLGDVNGKSILHLQCHFGQDSLSLARMGAKVTGIDLSTAAIAEAQKLNTELGLDAEFTCTNIYDLPQVLDRQFDIVFTSYGTICWLPDLTAWAKIVSQYLAPGGSFIFAEFHPAVWMFDNHFTHVQYPYFNREPIEEVEAGTYADQNAPIALNSITWNHHLSEIFQSLLNEKLQMVSFEEFDYSPYPCFPETVEIAPRKYQIPGMEGKLPMMYGLKMVKVHG